MADAATGQRGVPGLHTALEIELDSVGGGVAVYRATRVPASEAGIDDGSADTVSSFVVSTVADLALVSAMGDERRTAIRRHRVDHTLAELAAHVALP